MTFTDTLHTLATGAGWQVTDTDNGFTARWLWWSPSRGRHVLRGTLSVGTFHNALTGRTRTVVTLDGRTVTRAAAARHLTDLASRA